MTGGKGEKKEIKVAPIHPPAFTIELVDDKNAPMGGISCEVSVDGEGGGDKVTDASGTIGTLRPKKKIKVTMK